MAGSYSVCLLPKAWLTLKPIEVLQDHLQPNCGKPQGQGFCPQLGQPVPVLKRSRWKEPSLYAQLVHQLFQLVKCLLFFHCVLLQGMHLQNFPLCNASRHLHPLFFRLTKPSSLILFLASHGPDCNAIPDTIYLLTLLFFRFLFFKLKSRQNWTP